MADIIGKYRKGKIQLNVIRGEYKGKPTTSFSIQKRAYDNGEWKTSDFLSITDLQDILTLTTRVCSNYVKFDKIELKPKESGPEAEAEGFEEETPF